MVKSCGVTVPFGAFQLLFLLLICYLFVIHKTCITVIQVENGMKGGLELVGVGVGFKWEVGDVMLLDSDLLEHGVPLPDGKTIGNRETMVGIFIVHKTFLYLQGRDV